MVTNCNLSYFMTYDILETKNDLKWNTIYSLIPVIIIL